VDNGRLRQARRWLRIGRQLASFVPGRGLLAAGEFSSSAAVLSVS
jgi:hypothetical protein